ncbi:MAG: tRNA (guanine-N7-)-methyltransferase [Bacteriovoracaceae bacterium]|jgi:tRNA (guanine-N7-)-methyltransferase
MLDHSFNKGFEYTHKNPYHERLAGFSDFVLRDEEAEEFQGKWNTELFKREAPLVVEIGSGYGQFMREYCQDFPEHNYVGMDYRFKRSFELAKKLKNLNLDHMKYLRAKGERLGFLFGENEIDSLLYFFPDPWPKARHKKKRLFQSHFLPIVHKALKPGGKMFIKTDHDDYANHMQEVIDGSELFDVELATKDLRSEFKDHFLCQYTTKFEKIFIKQNQPIKAFVLTKKI